MTVAAGGTALGITYGPALVGGGIDSVYKARGAYELFKISDTGVKLGNIAGKGATIYTYYDAAKGSLTGFFTGEFPSPEPSLEGRITGELLPPSPVGAAAQFHGAMIHHAIHSD